MKSYPEYGTLSLGGNFFGMHYNRNEEAFTFGNGGYFSPQFYFLANVPLTWEGHYQTHWHYEVVGGLGIQAFQKRCHAAIPAGEREGHRDRAEQCELPALTSVSANWDIRARLSYQITSHWFAGFFVSGNNTRNYNFVSAGFSIHYMFRSQPSAVASPTGLFPEDGLRPFTVP